MIVNTLLRIALSSLILLSALGANLTSPQAKSGDRYPNQLPAFRFYEKYLSPLRPGVSDEGAVRRVLGDTATVKRDGWIITPLFMAKGDPVNNHPLGSLAEIGVRPESVISMRDVKFPKEFVHCHALVSEMNVPFDVYSDRFGLEYWLHEEDSKWGKKGDLFRIVYGPTNRDFTPKAIC
jgi:hypothetical protein